MAISYYLVQLAPYQLYFLLTGFFAIGAGFATFFVRKFITVGFLRSHNEVTGFIFIAISAFYSLLLSFVVLVVWDQLNETRRIVSNEGSSAVGLYRDIKYFPDSNFTKPLLVAYLNFAYNVIDDEFPNMEIMKPSRKTPESLSKVYSELEKLKPRSDFEVQLVGEMFSQLNQLTKYRALRVISMETEIPAPIWWPIILGAIITIFFSLILDIESRKMHVIINSLFGIVIASFIFIIVILDHPYTGVIGLKPKAYREIFTLESWESQNPSN
jgi:hypothetical protein